MRAMTTALVKMPWGVGVMPLIQEKAAPEPKPLTILHPASEFTSGRTQALDVRLVIWCSVRPADGLTSPTSS